MKYTKEQKYDFLFQRLFVSDIDWWESDAMLKLGPIYFQFPMSKINDGEITVEEAIEYCMKDAKL